VDRIYWLKLTGLLFLLRWSIFEALPADNYAGSASSNNQQIEGQYIYNIPDFPEKVSFTEAAVNWFGRITPEENFVDVRMGYTQKELYLRFSVVDRRLWYDPKPTPDKILNWDALSIFIDTGSDLFRINSQLVPYWIDSAPYRAIYQKTRYRWNLVNIPVSISSGYRGSGGFNQNSDNRGWTQEIKIPFSSLGLNSSPEKGTSWRLAFANYDRDTAHFKGSCSKWPPDMNENYKQSWGILTFGIPLLKTVNSNNPQIFLIREGLNYTHVIDASVGGSAICGEGTDFWNTWGDTTDQFYDQYKKMPVPISQFNIQNQSDIADWPCFSKIYITFPLNKIPVTKELISAKLILHLFGNANPEEAKPSYIQIYRAKEAWQEDFLSWNNAPLPAENYSGTWVKPVPNLSSQPSVRYEWNVSQAAYQALLAKEPLHLILYSGDADYHSGKYFWSSHVSNSSANFRPTLEITIGD